MKNIKLKKLIINSLLSLSLISIVSPIKVEAAWKSNSTGWWYTEGSSYATGWRLIDGNWYYFYNNGYMAYDTTIDGYYLNSSGAWTNNKGNSAQSKLIGKWYGLYMDTSKSGIITSNTIAGIPYIVVEDNGDSLIIEINENGYKEKHMYNNFTENTAMGYLYNPARGYYTGGTLITKAN